MIRNRRGINWMWTIAVAIVAGLATARTAEADPLRVSFDDPTGDAAPFDLIRVTLDFDNTTGDFELTYRFNAATPFVGTANFNANLLNGDISPLTTDPSFVGINRFNTTAITAAVPTTVITVLGNNSRLMSWNAGDAIANNSSVFGLPIDALFTSFLSNADGDILNASSSTVEPVPEPGSLALLGLGCAVLGIARYRRRKTRSSG